MQSWETYSRSQTPILLGRMGGRDPSTPRILHRFQFENPRLCSPADVTRCSGWAAARRGANTTSDDEQKKGTADGQACCSTVRQNEEASMLWDCVRRRRDRLVPVAGSRGRAIKRRQMTIQVDAWEKVFVERAASVCHPWCCPHEGGTRGRD